MNNIIMIGRLTKDPELRYTSGSGMAVTRFSIAVNRPFAKKDDEIKADFFNVIVWGKKAEISANYLKKGLQVAIQGRLQNNNYTDKNGVKQYTVEIIADNVEFIEWGEKKSQVNDSDTLNGLDEAGYKALSDEEVPF